MSGLENIGNNSSINQMNYSYKHYHQEIGKQEIVITWQSIYFIYLFLLSLQNIIITEKYSIEMFLQQDPEGQELLL